MAITEEHAPERRPHDEGGSHGSHPSDMTYVKIALVLSALTAFEVWISYTKRLGDGQNVLLIVLAIMKFFLVVLFFMHLRFDNRTFRYLFFGGMILAAFCYIAVLRMFHVLF